MPCSFICSFFVCKDGISGCFAAQSTLLGSPVQGEPRILSKTPCDTKTWQYAVP